MPQSPCYRPVDIRPVTGLMDSRSNPNDVPFGGYRFVENMAVTQRGKLCRMMGWIKAFGDSEVYNNQDLHDQLFGYTRQNITLLHEAVTPAGFSKLFAGTQNRIYAFNPSSGNWKVISDLLGGEAQSGCAEKRFYADSLGDTVILTNGVDKIMAHVIDQPAIEDNDQSVATIPDLEELNITRAKVVISWENHIFLMNVFQDGKWHPNRIIWSDRNRPTSFLPGEASLAGFQDLDSKDAILEARAVKGSMLIFTTNGIAQGDVAGAEQVFSFAKRWTPGDGRVGVLAYRNTLVSTGEELYYFGSDGIYKYSMFDQEPVRADWIHRSSNIIFDNIEKGRCAMHVGGYESDEKGQKRLWWSWGEVGDICPTRSMAYNVEYQFASHVDHGISAFLYHEPDTQQSLRDFILDNCICTLEELATYGDDFVKEGQFCYDEEERTCDAVPASYYSQTALTVGGVTSEDWTGEADSDSLFTILGNTTFADLCDSELTADECGSEKVFLFASTEDMCIKQTAEVAYREKCTDIDGCGLYSRLGYRSRMLSGAMDLRIPSDDKNVNRFAIEAHAQVETVPAQIKLLIGYASHAVDPLEASDLCAIIWDEQDTKSLKCLSDVSAAVHKAQGTRPNDEIEWPLYHTGRYLYFDLVILNSEVEPEDTGGVVCFSRFTFDAVAEPRC